MRGRGKGVAVGGGLGRGGGSGFVEINKGTEDGQGAVLLLMRQ